MHFQREACVKVAEIGGFIIKYGVFRLSGARRCRHNDEVISNARNAS